MEEGKCRKVTFCITPEADAVLSRHREFGYLTNREFLNTILEEYAQKHPAKSQEDAFTPEQERRLKVLIRQILENEGYRSAFR